MFRISKFKLLVSFIVIEVITIVVLIGMIVFDFNIKYPHNKVITFTQSTIIYSSDDDTTPFTGRMQDTLYNKVIVEFDVVNGFKDGEFIMLTIDGNYAVHGFMKQNKNHGEWKYFYDTGELECTGLFSDDQPTGMWEWYYSNGIKKCEGNYIRGKEEGLWIKYDETGLPVTYTNYRAGDVISTVNTNIYKNV